MDFESEVDRTMLYLFILWFFWFPSSLMILLFGENAISDILLISAFIWGIGRLGSGAINYIKRVLEKRKMKRGDEE